MAGAERAGSTPGDSLDQAAVQQFVARLRGKVLRPGDSTYDEVRRVFNAMIDRRPALIARCSGAADVVAGVEFAQEQGIPLSVRCK